jgi:hypothetical protein
MPCGTAFAIFLGLAYLATYKLFCNGILPLWASITCGVLILCLGVYIEYKYGVMEF